MDGGETARTWAVCRRRFRGSTLKPSSGRPATRMNISISAAGRRWSLRNCSRMAATSADVSVKNCSRSNSFKRGGKASWPTKRSAKAGMTLGSWQVAGGRLMYGQGPSQPRQALILRGSRPPGTRMDAGFQAKAHQSARKVRLPPIGCPSPRQVSALTRRSGR
jgi:hypothetical protein